MVALAYTMLPGRGDTDLLLATFARAVMDRGHTVCGCVQHNIDKGPDRKCDMMVRTLPGNEVFLISQTLGSGSRGCRLNQDALEKAVAAAEAGYDRHCGVLIVNKFGKHEAAGRGFRGLIARAVEDGVPVIVGLNALNAQAFADFAQGLEVRVEPCLEALMAWLEGAMRMAHRRSAGDSSLDDPAPESASSVF